MLKLVRREPMPDDATLEVWRDGEEVVYRLVVPPDEHLRHRTASDVSEGVGRVAKD
jgi:uncharacterized protein with PhoU and TrkA domain